jgi:hypothetical protein
MGWVLLQAGWRNAEGESGAEGERKGEGGAFVGRKVLGKVLIYL